MRRLFFLFVLLLPACSQSQPVSTSHIITISSQDVPLQPLSNIATSERVVALANGSAEVIYALGLGQSLVGRDIASSFSGDQRVPIVTSAHSVSAEKVLAQRPTLVIADERTGPTAALTQIRQAGVKVALIPEAWTLEEVPRKIAAIATILGVPDRGRKLELAQKFQQVPTRADSSRIAFLYVRGPSAIYLLGGRGSGADALISAIGATDVGASLGLSAFTPLTSESLARANPDVFLVMTKGLQSVGGIDGLRRLPGVAQTEAGIHGKVIAVDDSLLLSFGPRTGPLLKALQQALRELS